MIKSTYFSMVVSGIEHPALFQYIQQTRTLNERGQAKKFICDAAEHALKSGEEARQIERLEERLDEIREMLRRGVVLQDVDAGDGGGQESEKVSSLLSKLGM